MGKSRRGKQEGEKIASETRPSLVLGPPRENATLLRQTDTRQATALIPEYGAIMRRAGRLSGGRGEDEMRKRNGTTNGGGGRSQMSRHVSGNGDVSLVTGG